MVECIKRAIMISMAGLLLAGSSCVAFAEEKENMPMDVSDPVWEEYREPSMISGNPEDLYRTESESELRDRSETGRSQGREVVEISDEKVGLSDKIEDDGQTLGVPGTVLYKIQDHTVSTVKTLILVGLTVIGSALVGAVHAIKIKKTLSQNNREDK